MIGMRLKGSGRHLSVPLLPKKGRCHPSPPWGAIMQINFFIGIAGNPPRADTSAMGAINDSVGKLCLDN